MSAVSPVRRVHCLAKGMTAWANVTRTPELDGAGVTGAYWVWTHTVTEDKLTTWVNHAWNYLVIRGIRGGGGQKASARKHSQSSINTLSTTLVTNARV